LLDRRQAEAQSWSGHGASITYRSPHRERQPATTSFSDTLYIELFISWVVLAGLV
jgi:hypothetical protein